MHIIWIKAFDSYLAHSSMGNVSARSVHAEMAFATLLYRAHWSNWVMWSHLHIETRSRVTLLELRKRRGNWPLLTC